MKVHIISDNQQGADKIAKLIRTLFPDFNITDSYGPPLAYMIAALLAFVFIGGISPQILNDPQIFTMYLMIIISILVGIVLKLITV
jgi:hypothetical protein